MLTNKKAVRQLALDLATGRGRVRVGQTFLDAIEAAVREAVSKRINHHDNKCGSRMTLI